MIASKLSVMIVEETRKAVAAVEKCTVMTAHL